MFLTGLLYVGDVSDEYYGYCDYHVSISDCDPELYEHYLDKNFEHYQSIHNFYMKNKTPRHTDIDYKLFITYCLLSNRRGDEKLFEFAFKQIATPGCATIDSIEQLKMQHFIIKDRSESYAEPDTIYYYDEEHDEVIAEDEEYDEPFPEEYSSYTMNYGSYAIKHKSWSALTEWFNLDVSDNFQCNDLTVPRNM